MAGKGSDFRQHPKPLELIEEAVHLLRRSPPGVFASYYLGTVPFVLGFLFFWADMSRSFDATSRLVPGALALAISYVFMKTMQTVFALRLKNVITGGNRPISDLMFLARTAVMHSIYQPWGFILLPMALLVTVPFGWCFAFFQNMTVLGPGDGELPETRKRAWEQALLWPAQNHMALGILILFSFIVMANLFVAAIYAPHLFRILFGIETVFSRSGLYLANTTFVMIIAAATYLCVDPIVKSYYTLRCYYGQSLESGEDLITELRSARRFRMKGLTVTILAVFVCLSSNTAISKPAVINNGTTAIQTGRPSPEELERTVADVLTRIEYSWRLPRQAQDDPAEPTGFIYDLFKSLRQWVESIADAVDRFFEWLGDIFRKLFPRGDGPLEERSSGGVTGSAVLYILIFAGAAACALILQRLFRSKSQDDESKMTEPSVTKADLEDENILASDLPENEWMAMARELLEMGEVRLGIRAMYLACLAHLAAGDLITLARHKTDREYERELTLRGEVLQELASAFADITGIFERAWYGMHSIPEQTLEYYLSRLQEVMTYGA